MEISKDNNIFSIIQNQSDILDETTEWIVDINNVDDEGNIIIWTELEFNNFTSVMKSLKYEEEIGKQYLLVKSGEDILKITNTPNITKYCVYDNHKIVPHEWIKEKEVLSEDINNLFDTGIKISVIKKTETVQPDNWDDIRKNYKIVIPISYTDKNGTIFRVNIIKHKEEDYYTLKQSGIFKKKQLYEFKIIINNKDLVINSIIRIIQSITLSTLILSKPQQTTILNEYHNLIKKDILVNPYHNDKDEIPLITPKPITLERINMIDPSEYGAISILTEYTVTEKADGERLLIYINNKGNVYLINNTYTIQDTGIIANKNAFNTLIDGEYISCNKRLDGSKKNLYAAFDIYYFNGKKITNLPLIDKKESRYDILQKVPSLLDEKKSVVEFIVKKHYYTDNILNDCNEILTNHDKYPYEIDGLIFTPAKLSVYSYYVNKEMPLTTNTKWDRVFKWKPIEQNTIDFLVKERKQIIKDGITYKELELHVGYNATQWEDISPTEGLKIRYTKEASNKYKLQRKSFIPKPFKPKIEHTPGVDYTPGVEIAYIPINNKNEIRALNNDIIDDDSIVEFRYIPDKDRLVHLRWEPLRVREDKTRIFKKGKLSKTANELGVAINIWRSIHLPVTTAMITGNEEVFSKNAPDDLVSRLLDTDDIYYAREIPRDSLLSVSMLNFHNQIVKRNLYMKPERKGTLLELACGQFGDLNRWTDAEYSFVLGVDLVRNNIYNPRYGAWSRIIKRHNQLRRKVDGTDKVKYMDLVAVVGDCAVPLKDGSAAVVAKDTDSENILKVVLNRQNSVPQHLKHIAGRGSNGFDVVSSMFAIHYFFQSEEKLDGFLANVSQNLKRGGSFICTFMDGKKVEEAIEEAGGDLVEGRKKLSDDDTQKTVPVWAIVRRFNKNEKSDYSKRIDVYIENTQRLIPEYLVNYELLVEKAKNFNLELSETEMFRESFNKAFEMIPDNEDARMNIHEHLLLLNDDNIQKKFSFLNRWVIFKKK